MIASMTLPAPSEAMTLRASGRTWLVGPAHLAPVLRRAPRSGPRRVDGFDDMAAVRRLFAKYETGFGCERRSDLEVMRWLQRGVARGRLMALDVTPDASRLEPSIRPRKIAALSIPGGLPASPAFLFPIIDHAARFSFYDRCMEMLLRAGAWLEREQREAFEDYLSPENLANAAAALSQWAEEAAEGLTPSFDTALISMAYDLAGWPGLDGLERVACATQRTRAAVSDLDQDAAAEMLAGGVARLGVEPFMLLVTRQTLASREPAGSPNGALMRWATYIEKLDLRMLDPTRGAIWGAIGPRGESMAASLAHNEGSLTLARALQRTDFTRRYLAEFGPSFISPVAQRVWEMISIRFVRQLRGKLTLYTDVTWAGAPPAPFSARPLPVQRGATGLSLQQAAPAQAEFSTAARGGDLGILAPYLGPNITEVVVIDVLQPASAKRFRRDGSPL